jgi:hypothetical protein
MMIEFAIAAAALGAMGVAAILALRDEIRGHALIEAEGYRLECIRLRAEIVEMRKDRNMDNTAQRTDR